MIKKNLFSILVGLLLLYLSLTNSEKFEKISYLIFPFIDKIVHFGMYFVLMSVIIFENRKIIKNNRHMFLLALIPFSYGLIIEILQSTLTVSRSGSIYDVLFNTAGILVSILLWIYIKDSLKETIR